MTDQSYQQAVNWLFRQAPNYQKEGISAYKPGLENIRKLCNFFGNPQERIVCIHIGGTNGKGSTSNMLASVLQEAGYKVGLYNSPHLIDFTERIKINGENCRREFVYDFIEKLRSLPKDIQPSFFEFTTIMAFEYFFHNKVDYAVIEVGLGGRLDSTNIIKPLLTAITNVQLDHQNLLGDTIAQIATEKAGIIKPNIPVISGDSNPQVQAIIRTKAFQEKAPFIDASTISVSLETDLKGQYQKKNIRVVSAMIDELRKKNLTITSENVYEGLQNVQRNTGFIGRWYQFSAQPLTICDTAHNLAGLEEVFAQMETISKYKHIVLGFVNDKKIDEVLDILPKNASYYFAKPNIERGRSPYEYEEQLKKLKIKYKISESVQEAYLSAKQDATDEDFIFIGGSNFVVGEFLEKNLHCKE